MNPLLLVLIGIGLCAGVLSGFSAWAVETCNEGRRNSALRTTSISGTDGIRLAHESWTADGYVITMTVEGRIHGLDEEMSVLGADSASIQGGTGR